MPSISGGFSFKYQVNSDSFATNVSYNRFTQYLTAIKNIGDSVFPSGTRMDAIAIDEV